MPVLPCHYPHGTTPMSQPPFDCSHYFQADCVFWFGDLNYRVTCEREEADIVIQNNDLEVSLYKESMLIVCTVYLYNMYKCVNVLIF